LRPDRNSWILADFSFPIQASEVSIASGKTTVLACKEASIAEQTYYRWRREYGGLQVDQAKRLKELEAENAKLKRLVANLSLEKLVLKDIAAGNR
jgi:transposase-like protein